ncbi:MAG: OB-fold putative lipoprotein [Clostridium sp.]
MNKIKFFFIEHKILTCIVAIIILGSVYLEIYGNIFGLIYTQEYTDKQWAKAEEKATETLTKTISSTELSKAYVENNIVKADEHYKDRTVEIIGKVDIVGQELSQSYIILSSEKGVPNVQLFFEKESEINKLGKLNTGDTVTAQGVVAGKLKSKNVAVTDCILK